jgi:hypothetical protein
MIHVSVSFVCSTQSNMILSNVQFILLFWNGCPSTSFGDGFWSYVIV